ncbi:DUF6318 family protein [Mumia quercus]|uniref:DUF6318 family protein n=1 Tax=Mumia quercus TaxID=2976125 RepID=UPI0021D07134|nr:DUF6318 family protein [Mumia quercus]
MSRLGTALVAAVALLSVGACTGEEPADGDPSATPRVSATPSATSTPTPPPLPAEAREHSADGAAAFVEYYIAVFNYAATTGDTTALAAASMSTCSACNGLVKRYEQIYLDGGTSQDPGWRPTVTSSQLVAGQFHVTIDLRTATHDFRPRKGAPAHTVEAKTYHDLYRLKWVDDGWRIDSLVPQEVPE